MFETIFDLIKKHDSIVIFGHANPDGDCYGSQVGLKEVLKLAFPEKHIYIVGDGLPAFFSLLSKMDDVSDEIISKSLGILVDGNDLNRMSDPRVHNCLAWCKIDHHIDVGSFTEGPSVVDPNANSACDLITSFILENNLPINAKAASALYLGILTDTGRFQFVNDYPNTFARVTFLCNNGADPREINKLLNTTEESTLALKGYMLSNYKKSKGGVIYIVFTKEILKKLGVSANEASNMINIYSNVIGYPVWATFAENPNGDIRVELRSNGPAVQPLAASIGGGGHMYASGARLAKLDLQQIDSFIEKIDVAISEWRKKN